MNAVPDVYEVVLLGDLEQGHRAMVVGTQIWEECLQELSMGNYWAMAMELVAHLVGSWGFLMGRNWAQKRSGSWAPAQMGWVGGDL